MNLIVISKNGKVLKAVEVNPRFTRDPLVWKGLTAKAGLAGLEIKCMWSDKACNYDEMLSLLSDEGRDRNARASESE